jgi:hypothetical protein
MKIRSGHIPTDIVYIFGGPVRVTRRWDDADQPDDELVFTEVIPAFVADSDNEKTINTGMSWAKNRCTRWNSVTNKAEMIGTVQKVNLENKPISNIRVIGLEIRGQGGRAYKVITPDGFYFDLREDVLLDTMLTKGILPGGFLSGEYLWGRVGTEMKLIRVGSELYTALLEAGERTVLSYIPKNKLEVGAIYESKQGERGIFLGYITTESWRLEWPNGQSALGHYYLKTNQKPKLVAKKLNRHMLWFDVSHWLLKNKKTDPTVSLFQKAMSETGLSHHFKLRGSHSMVKIVGKTTLPDDVIEQVRQKALVSYDNRISGELASQRNHSSSNDYRIENVVACAAAVCLMRKVGDPRPVVPENTFQHIEQFLGKEI